MADTKISALTDGSPLQSTDDIPVARSGTNRRVRIDLSNYATAAQGALADSAVQPGDIDTLAEINAIITDATLDDAGDARTPTAHAASHATGGGDPITPADIGAVPDSRTLTAGTGLDGGGDLSANRTLNLNAATIASLALADTAVQPGGLAAVATSGAYADLSGTPTIPTTALPVAVVSVTGNKTLLIADAQTEQVCDSGSTITLTIPANAAVAFPVGTKTAVLGIGAGTVTITASGGVTLNGTDAGSADLSAQYSAAVITKVATDAWVINGDHGSVT